VRLRLDAIDHKILKELQDDGRVTNVELSQRVGISAPPCLRRVRALELAGYLKGYRALLDEKRLGFEVTVFAMVHLSSQTEADLQAFEPDAEVVVLAVMQDQRLLAVLPLTRKRIWFHGIQLSELRGAANFHSVTFDLLRVPGPQGDAAIAQIWQRIRAMRDWHVLELPSVPQEGGAHELLQQAARDGFATLTDVFADSPVLHVKTRSDGRPDPVAETNSRFRHELRRAARRLQSELGAPPELCRIAQPESEALKRFYELEASGWKGSNGTAIQSCSDTLHYY